MNSPTKFSVFRYEEGSSRGANSEPPEPALPSRLRRVPRWPVLAAARFNCFTNNLRTFRRGAISPFRETWLGGRLQPWRLRSAVRLSLIQSYVSLFSNPPYLTRYCTRKKRVQLWLCPTRCLENAAEYIDKGWSGAKASRPEFDKLAAGYDVQDCGRTTNCTANARSPRSKRPWIWSQPCTRGPRMGGICGSRRSGIQ
jgi:hypothetical protein